MNLRDTLKVNSDNILEIGGVDACELVKRFGSPLYVMDIDYIEKMCDVYVSEIEKYGSGKVLYASKAFSCLAIYEIVKAKGLGVDVVSQGELFTALKAGTNPSDIYFHGNNKLKSEIEFAIENNIGYFVVDSIQEMQLISQIAKLQGKTVNAILRINPGVEAHTHHYIQTAKIDSKFGFSISNGDAINAVREIKKYENIIFSGLHCHIGSNIFEPKSFEIATQKMIDFMIILQEKLSTTVQILNMGGGYGIFYSEGDKALKPDDYRCYIQAITKTIDKAVSEKKIAKPYLIIEPGRSLVGEAGVTLYSVGNIKDIRGIKKYVSIDGGMFDNIRFALYNAKYTACVANNVYDENCEVVTIAGKCCEGGDVIIENINLPVVKRDDIICVFSTGAYNYSMSNNYNRNLVPPVVAVKNGVCFYLVKPQSLDDLIRNDCSNTISQI